MTPHNDAMALDSYRRAPYEADSCCGHPPHVGACRAIREGARCPEGCAGGVLIAFLVTEFQGEQMTALPDEFACDSCDFRAPTCPCITCDVCGAVDGHRMGCIGI